MRLLFLILVLLNACAPNTSECGDDGCAAGELCRAGRCVFAPTSFAGQPLGGVEVSPLSDLGFLRVDVGNADAFVDHDSPADVSGETRDLGVPDAAVVFGDVQIPTENDGTSVADDAAVALADLEQLDAWVSGAVDGNTPPLWCPSPGLFFAESGHCYLVVYEALSFGEARARCQDWHGDLITVDNAPEQVFAWTAARASAWIGLVVNAATWVDGSIIAYTNWRVGQPAGACGAARLDVALDGEWSNACPLDVVYPEGESQRTSAFICERGE